MNSTASSTNSLLPYFKNHLATLAVAWSCVVFCVLSIVVITRKTALDFSYLRLGCVGMGLLTLAIACFNAERATIVIADTTAMSVRDVFVATSMAFMVAVAMILGSKFYSERQRRGMLWKITAALAVLASITLLLCFVLLWFLNDSNLVKAAHMLGAALTFGMPFVVLVSYCYAFAPMIRWRRMSTRKDMPSVVVISVGIWYLTGMGILYLLEAACIFLSIPYPSAYYTEFDINKVAIALFLRMLNLDFFSFSPPRKAITAIREWLVPEEPQNGSGVEQLGFEMDAVLEMGLEAGRMGNEVTSKTRFT